MSLAPPILLHFISRTGSSLIAQMFRVHGIWVAQRQPNKYGYIPYGEIEHVINQYFHKSGVRGNPQRLRELCAECVASDMRWLMKHPIQEYEVAAEAFPERFNLFLRRDIDNATRSLIDKTGQPEKWDHSRRVREHGFAQMERRAAEDGGVVIDIDSVMAGNYATLRQAFEYCEIPFHVERARSVIDPSRWHYVA